jgi:hypothetical protein
MGTFPLPTAAFAKGAGESLDVEVFVVIIAQ